MPTGTPSVAVGVGDENPPGTTMEGKPVTDPRAPLRSTWVSPMGTTSRF